MNKTQGAIECLTTYGWALVVITIAICLLFIMIGEQTSKIECINSSGEITLQKYIIEKDETKFVLINSTGTNISNLTITKKQGFEGNWIGISLVPKNGIFEITGLTHPNEEIIDSSITIQYTKGVLKNNTTIVCNGIISDNLLQYYFQSWHRHISQII